MKIKTITAGKEFKIGLPNYSNITVNANVSAEFEDGEEVNWGAVWDTINQQLTIQSEGIDPSWIQTKEYNKFFKVFIQANKKGGEK